MRKSQTLPILQNEFQIKIQNQKSSKTSFGLRVYQKAFFFRILEVFTSEFVAVQKFMGEVEFSKQVRCFLKNHPPQSNYGITSILQKFPEFLAQQNYCLEKPWIIEMAKMEWAEIQIFYSKNPPPWNIDFFVTLTVHDLQNLHFKKSGRSNETFAVLFQNQYKLSDLWEKKLEIKTSSAPQHQAEYFVMYRNGHCVSLLKLTEKNFKILKQFYLGKPLKTLLEEHGTIAVKKLKVWGSRGILYPTINQR